MAGCLPSPQTRGWLYLLVFMMLVYTDRCRADIFPQLTVTLVCCYWSASFLFQYIKYAESTKPERVRDIYRRACHMHLKKKPNIHLAWAAYEEAQGWERLLMIFVRRKFLCGSILHIVELLVFFFHGFYYA